MIKKGEWVLLHQIVLQPDQRAPQVPEDTRSQPLELWVKGHLLEDAQLGQEARVRTRTGREVQGILLEAAPAYHHDFGAFVPELMRVGDMVRAECFGQCFEERA